MTRIDTDKWLDEQIDADLASEGIIPEIKVIVDISPVINTEIPEVKPIVKKHSDIKIESNTNEPAKDSFFTLKTGIIFDYDAEVELPVRISTAPSILTLDVSGNDPDVNYTAIRCLKQYRQYAEQSCKDGKDFDLFSAFVSRINKN